MLNAPTVGRPLSQRSQYNKPAPVALPQIPPDYSVPIATAQQYVNTPISNPGLRDYAVAYWQTGMQLAEQHQGHWAAKLIVSVLGLGCGVLLAKSIFLLQPAFDSWEPEYQPQTVQVETI